MQRSGRQPGPVANKERPAVDSAAIDRQLGDVMERVLDPQTSATGRDQATAIYNNNGVPPILRAQAAFMVAQAFLLDGKNAEACRWNGLALNLRPTNPPYQKFKRDQRCAS